MKRRKRSPRSVIDPILQKAFSLTRESKYIEFKEEFDVNSARDWCELTKDIVALANTGGGAIVFGVDNSGTPNGFDVRPVLLLDPANITNKIYSYTACQFSDFEFSKRLKLKHAVAVLRIQGVSIPMVFVHPGTYDVGGGKQKNAFGVGTVYFRHGAKSEPGNTEDIRKVIERQLEAIRKEWVRGVRKVVTAPKGSQVVTVPRTVTDVSAVTGRVRPSHDPLAPAVRLTRDTSVASGVFLHEELADGLFDEINNVLDANRLLAGTSEKFLLGPQVYFRIYAERHHVKCDVNQLRLLATTGLNLYGPVLHWLAQLSIDETARILSSMAGDPKPPNPTP